jgi:hypothetical protein
VLEIRQKNPKATGAVIIKLFYEETQRSITDSTIRRIKKNFDFLAKEINSNREKMAFEIIDGKLFEQKLCADFYDKSTVLD